ncbi:hypothetical protein G7046_g4167 [Stylonectria norvegica]|nr:hypothetical protein G7046_g4167 [Stylonectria norvegica]
MVQFAGLSEEGHRKEDTVNIVEVEGHAPDLKRDEVVASNHSGTDSAQPIVSKSKLFPKGKQVSKQHRGREYDAQNSRVVSSNKPEVGWDPATWGRRRCKLQVAQPDGEDCPGVGTLHMLAALSSVQPHGWVLDCMLLLTRGETCKPNKPAQAEDETLVGKKQTVRIITGTGDDGECGERRRVLSNPVSMEASGVWRRAPKFPCWPLIEQIMVVVRAEASAAAHRISCADIASDDAPGHHHHPSPLAKSTPTSRFTSPRLVRGGSGWITDASWPKLAAIARVPAPAGL